jgi:hypothetical protein
MRFKVALLMLLLTPFLVALGQVRAGTAEDRQLEQILGEANPDTKLSLISTFERDFPQSRVLARVYLMAVDVHRERKNPAGVQEYGEKALRFDDSNITAMMLLARSYAMEAKNLDRALELSQRALNQLQTMRTTGGMPAGYTANQWKDYLRSNEDAAEQILKYVSAVKTRADIVRNAQPSVQKPDAQVVAADAAAPTADVVSPK